MDTSESTIRYIFKQRDFSTNKLNSIAFDSRKLSPIEINYPIYKKELLAIKYTL